MKMKCLNKRCGYEGEYSEKFDEDVKCPCCGSVLIKVNCMSTLSEVEKNMENSIRWYGMEFVFSEIDKIGNPIHRCAHRKTFFGLLSKMGLKWRTELPKEK